MNLEVPIVTMYEMRHVFKWMDIDKADYLTMDSVEDAEDFVVIKLGQIYTSCLQRQKFLKPGRMLPS